MRDRVVARDASSPSPKARRSVPVEKAEFRYTRPTSKADVVAALATYSPVIALDDDARARAAHVGRRPPRRALPGPGRPRRDHHDPWHPGRPVASGLARTWPCSRRARRSDGKRTTHSNPFYVLEDRLSDSETDCSGDRCTAVTPDRHDEGMAKRPRGRCPVCRDLRSARWEGDALHRGAPRGSGGPCPGSGRKAPEEVAPHGLTSPG